MRYLDPNVNKFYKDSPQEQLYDSSGNLTITSKEMAYAKKVTTDNSLLYFIRVYDNVPFDPSGMFANREKYLDTKFKRVTKETFDFYMLFLKTNNSLYLTKAQRSYLND